MKIQKNRKGLSLIVSLLMVVLLIFVAIGIFWFATRGILEEGTEQLELGSKCLEINVEATAMNCTAGVCDVTYTRKAGGEDIAGIKLVISDGTESHTETIEEALNPLDTKTKTGIISGLTTPTSVEVAVYFKTTSGEDHICTPNVFTLV
ncbi:hypothetical protein KAR52_03660 [Candidatus Pacearchaeota archaeon]|nr:hypothetical protein [Candidatus Pacearchaeota archaeon]